MQCLASYLMFMVIVLCTGMDASLPMQSFASKHALCSFPLCLSGKSQPHTFKQDYCRHHRFVRCAHS